MWAVFFFGQVLSPVVDIRDGWQLHQRQQLHLRPWPVVSHPRWSSTRVFTACTRDHAWWWGTYPTTHSPIHSDPLVHHAPRHTLRLTACLAAFGYGLGPGPFDHVGLFLVAQLDQNQAGYRQAGVKPISCTSVAVREGYLIMQWRVTNFWSCIAMHSWKWLGLWLMHN